MWQSLSDKYFKLRGDNGIVRRDDLLNMNTAFKKDVDYALVEVCFHDNPMDYSIYDAHKTEIAVNMARAIAEAFGLPRLASYTVHGCSFLNVRETPNGKVIWTLANKDEVLHLSNGKDSDGDVWWLIKTNSGITGYVWPKYLV